MEVRRLEDNPIVRPNIGDRIGNNINGPSLIRVPEWVGDPLGTYYLYFASHRGTEIYLAYADDVTGKWTLHTPSPLCLRDAGEGFDDHIASPDVHIDENRKRIEMYYHGCCSRYEDETGIVSQFTRIALSEDGLIFDARPEPLGRFYFRAFEYEGDRYALAKENRGKGQRESGQRVYRSPDGHGRFEPGPILFQDGSRHTAVRRREDTLDVFYSRIGDAPECILHATVDLSSEWGRWRATKPEPLLEPEYEWEGTSEPIEPSRAGAVIESVHQIRDPAVFEERDKTYLLYSVAGERGIAIAKLLER